MEEPGQEARGQALRQALREKRAGHIRRALTLANELAEASPSDAEALRLRAWLYIASDDRDRAIADFRAVLELGADGDYAEEAREALGRLGVPAAGVLPVGPAGEESPLSVDQQADVYRQAEIAMRCRRYGQAATALRRLVRQEPGYEDGAACALLARALLLSLHARDAVELLTPLQEAWRGNARACHEMALCAYAVAQFSHVDETQLEAAITAAFCQPEKEYPTEAPEIRAVVDPIVRKYSEKRSRAKALYDFVRLRTRYDKSLIPLGRRTVLFTLSSRRAVCTGFAQLYITLCRAAGVPARLVAGEGRSGFHNWAEVWLGDDGWVPVDPTRGRNMDNFGRLTADICPYHSQRENW